MKLANSEFGSSRLNHARSAGGGPGELSYLTVPVRAQGRTLGGLSVVSVASQRRYDRADLIVAEALATQVGFALENARLYEAQRAMVARLEQARNELDAAEGARLREDERQRIARELHDRVEQTFFALALTAQLAMDEDREASAVLSTALQRIGELATSGAEEMRAAIFSLNHASFAGRGLVEALWTLVRDFQQRTGTESDLVLTGVQRTVPADAAEALHGIAREALANVERHSRARAVVLGLHLTRRSVTLTVHDDGLGASALVLKQIADSTTHFGLRGIRERVNRLGGTLRIGPAPDGGFMVRARIPLRAELGA
jgi:signal transduction histidine kinase